MIYFIKSPRGPIKIGTTIRFDDRMISLKSEYGHDLFVMAEMDGSRKKEREIHARFSHIRIDPDREWFEPAPDLLDFIKSEAQPYLPRPKGKLVSIDKDLAGQVKYIATVKGKTVLEILSSMVRPILEREFLLLAPKVGEKPDNS